MKELAQHEWPGLPKWPGVFVTGKNVTPAQAKDIIFRTDTSITRPSEYMGGNDRYFQSRCVEHFAWKPLIELENKMWRFTDKDTDDAATREATRLARQQLFDMLEKHGYHNTWAIGDAWKTEMGIIDTQYVYNSLLSSAYIGGPTGWVSPDGVVSVDGHNYGKWPSVEDIVEDWKALATAFPYIDLQCSLFDGEACEDDTKPVCTIIVKEGKVMVCAPDLSLHTSKPDPAKNTVDDAIGLISALQTGRYYHEQGWPAEWVKEFAVKSTAAMRKVAPFLFQEPSPS